MGLRAVRRALTFQEDTEQRYFIWNSNHVCIFRIDSLYILCIYLRHHVVMTFSGIDTPSSRDVANGGGGTCHPPADGNTQIKSVKRKVKSMHVSKIRGVFSFWQGYFVPALDCSPPGRNPSYLSALECASFFAFLFCRGLVRLNFLEYSFKCQYSKNNPALSRTFDVGRKHFPAFCLHNHGQLQAAALLVEASICLNWMRVFVRVVTLFVIASDQ